MRKSRLPLFIFLILLAIVLAFWHYRSGGRAVESGAANVARPFVYVFQGIGHSFGSFFSYFASVRHLTDENAQLQNRILSLQQDNITLQQYKLENDKLKEELAYRATSPLSFIPAVVFAKDPTGFTQTVIINAGSNDGVQTGSAVLAQGVLIGKVIETDSETSKVLLITDPQSAVDAQISATGDNAVVRGSYGSGLTIDMVSQNVQISKGDQVVTAGLNSDVPKGIFIGTIGDIISKKNDLLQKATVVPGVDLKNLDFVSVLKK
ncbi:rod shape-determining protein MreC [Patescibacteria group bacterium]|nr:rod shape-determining protein MreC [Patescibacteria group bacterium]